MRFRGKSIRRKIVALLLVPLISLTALWGYATFLTTREADHLIGVGYVVEKVGYPVEDIVRVIQVERRQSLLYLADPRASDSLAALRRQRSATDDTIAELRANAQDPEVRDELQPGSVQRLDLLLDALDGIDSLRSSVERRSIDRIQALTFFDRFVDPCYGFLMTLHGLESVELDKQGRALVGVARAREMLAREDALVVSALIARRVTSGELRAISDLVAHRTFFYEANLEVLPADERRRFEEYWSSPATGQLRKAEDALIAAGPTKNPRGVDAAGWEELSTRVLDDLARENTEAGDRYQDRVRPAVRDVLFEAGVAGILGFLALLASVVVSVRIGRALVRDLRTLRKEAHEVSGVRLPSVMRRLAAGEQVDVETEVPRLEYDKDEVGQVGHALNTLQRAAVEAAVKQSEMRRGVAEVFVNLARRNQVLLHRQLTLLDTMERRTEDSEELADLFRLDHLTTRMRRHAEGLVILSGAAPSRQWRKPVQLMDVVRAAVAEVEDYERIEVRRLPRIGVGGPAVADLTHLIAELLENATVFSPPHTAVQVLGERVANGFTLEIHDRGLGMNADALLDANLRLAETPEFELSDTDRLGLFVVSRLAQRQNVRVSLQISPYGGTTAVVFIPAALLTDAPETEGSGFRLDRKSPAEPAPRPALTQVPSRGTAPARRGAPAVLDGPVELEAPVSGIDALLESAGDLEDTESERGGIFRARELRRRGSDEQHQQAYDQGAARGAADRDPGRDDGPVPLPRRRPPTLVSDHGRRVDEPGRAHPAPAKDTAPGTNGVPARDTGRDRPTLPTLIPGRKPDPASAPGPAAPPAPTLVPVPPEGPAPFGGLPRRVRQASLAPQLRDASAGGGAEPRTTGPTEPDAERDAEEVRRRMSSMQRGWQRGRQQNAQNQTGETAPGTTPEGDGR
ncbi:nitrate- and nitrite sensing domain-containing protein [Streptomyces sp. HUAS MG47]|uniref:nitrate- and nitrite sensing domain-containing protein n=1 Tax=Streptomyces solicamelliae TaxID=3231716 RepID=UPI0038782258